MQGKRLKLTLPLTRLSNMCLNSSSHKTACFVPHTIFFFFLLGITAQFLPVTTNVALLRMMVVVQEPIEGIVRLFLFLFLIDLEQEHTNNPLPIFELAVWYLSNGILQLLGTS